MKSFFHRIYHRIATYFTFAGFFLEIMLFVWPIVFFYKCFWPNDEKKKLRCHRLACKVIGVRVKTLPFVNIEADFSNKEFEKPAIIISNHQSQIDIVSILMLSPKIVAVTNSWVWNFPVYKPILSYLEFYPNGGGVDNMEEKFASLIERGYSILIFPEGTRSADCKILKFHRGAFYLAEKLHADILPIYLDGAGKALPKGGSLQKETVKVIVGNRVSADDQSMGTNYREMTRAWHKHYIAFENKEISEL